MIADTPYSWPQADPARSRQDQQERWQSPRRPARPWTSRAPKSPRRRGKGEGKPSAKGQDTGGKGKTKQPVLAVPQVEGLPAPPVAPAPVLPKKAATEAGGTASQDRLQLETLLASLATASDLPQAAQEMVSEFQRTSSRNTAKDLHKAVADQAKARQELVKLRGNRSAYLQAWQQYVAQVMELLDAQVKSQDTILEGFNQSELEWIQQEAQATSTLARLAQLEGATGPQEMTVDESEELVSEAIEAEQRLRREQEEQQRKSRQMLEALQAVRQHAEEQVRHDREGSRTPRRRTAEAEGDAKPEGTAATPFKLGPVPPSGEAKSKNEPPFPKAHT